MQSAASSRPAGRRFRLLATVVLLAIGLRAADVPPATTVIQDTIYRANGTPARGTLVISWPAFETADHKTVAAGLLSVQVAENGALSVPLTPNQGAKPEGTFYKVVAKLDDGTTTTEYWNVPNVSPATIASVRTTILPGAAPPSYPTQNVVQEAEVSSTPQPNKIPRADANGKIAEAWAANTVAAPLQHDNASDVLSCPGCEITARRDADSGYVGRDATGNATVPGNLHSGSLWIEGTTTGGVPVAIGPTVTGAGSGYSPLLVNYGTVQGVTAGAAVTSNDQSVTLQGTDAADFIGYDAGQVVDVSGTVDRTIAYHVNGPIRSQGSINRAFGIYVEPIQSAAANEAIHIADAGLGANDYAIVVDGGKSYLGGQVTTKNGNGVRFAAGFPGADMGAQINAADADCPGGCTIMLPEGSFDLSTPIHLHAKVKLQGAGREATRLRFTAASGVGIDQSGVEHVTVTGLSLHCTAAGNSVTGLRANSSAEIVWSEVYVEGCAKNWAVTGTDAFPSNNVFIGHSESRNYTMVGLQADHVIGLKVTDSTLYAATNNPAHAWGIVVDSGLSGANFQSVDVGYAGMIIQNSSPASAAPVFLAADQLALDTCYSDCLKFDSSLNTGSNGPGYSYAFTNLWTAYSRLNGTAGVHIQGGRKIDLVEWNSRVNHYHGGWIEGGSDINIVDASICANNLQNAADGDGIRVASNVTGFSILGSNISNMDCGDSGGHQKYGVRIEAGTSDNYIVAHVRAAGNDTGPLSDGGTGISKTVLDVLPASGNYLAGSLGLGTVTPKAHLHVAGSGIFDGTSARPTGATKKGVYIGPADYDGTRYFGGYAGFSAWFDGTNWKTGSDGGSNGGVVLMGGGSGDILSVFAVPHNGTAQQTIAPTALGSFLRMEVSPAGVSWGGGAAIASSDGVESTAHKGQANGYAGLDASGRVPASQLPGLTVTKSVKGSNNSNCNLVFTNGLLTSSTCP